MLPRASSHSTLRTFHVMPSSSKTLPRRASFSFAVGCCFCWRSRAGAFSFAGAFLLLRYVLKLPSAIHFCRRSLLSFSSFLGRQHQISTSINGRTRRALAWVLRRKRDCSCLNFNMYKLCVYTRTNNIGANPYKCKFYHHATHTHDTTHPHKPEPD